MTTNVTKADLITASAKAANIPKAAAEKALNSVITEIENGVSKGKRVTLIGFGSFSSAKRKARTGRNPQTGKPIKIAASTVAKFNPGKRFKEKVNKKRKR